MGIVGGIINLLFGGGRNVLRDTAHIFRENAEQGAVRSHDVQVQAMNQFSGEFAIPRRGFFDRLMDGVNRLPRPAMALGTLGLFVAAMVDPLWFAARMQGVALVPEPLWWLLGVVVSFYFGARHQLKNQDFQTSLAKTMARAPQVIDNIDTLQTLQDKSPGVADAGPDAKLAVRAVTPDANSALEDWRKLAG